VSHFLSPARKLRIVIATAALAVAAFAIPVLHSLAASPAKTIDLDIAKFAFMPKEITVAPGTKIVWRNRDEAPHTVASTNKSFASKGLDTDDKFEHTFDREGDFTYICTVHPFMTGVVHVRNQ
jgi:plastocyanin